MRKYALNIPAYKGCVVYGFSDDDKLFYVDMSGADLPQDAYLFLWSHLPANPKALEVVKGKTGVITELVEDIDFEMFWKKYDDRSRSSKVKTERFWNKMKRDEQIKAYNFIGRYNASIQPGICRKYATTYLNDQMWNN